MNVFALATGYFVNKHVDVGSVPRMVASWNSWIRIAWHLAITSNNYNHRALSGGVLVGEFRPWVREILDVNSLELSVLLDQDEDGESIVVECFTVNCVVYERGL